MRNDAIDRTVIGRTDRHPLAIVSQDVQLDHIVDGLAAHHRMDAARVVADHAAQRVVAVRRWIGRERQVMPLGGVAQRIEHDARLDARFLALCIERHDAVQVLRHIDDDGGVAALAAQARSAAARKQRRAVLAARGHRRDHGIDRSRDDDADRRLPIVRCVGRVERTAARVEAHFAVDRRLKIAFELSAHIAKRRASAYLNASPMPGRVKSGATAPPTGSIAPSNNIRSMRT